MCTISWANGVSAVPCRAVPCRAVPCRAVPCRAVPCRAVPCRAVPCRAVPYRAVPCRAVPSRAVPCRAVPCRAVPCRAVPCRAVPCRTVPYRTVPYRTVPYRANSVCTVICRGHCRTCIADAMSCGWLLLQVCGLASWNRQWQISLLLVGVVGHFGSSVVAWQAGNLTCQHFLGAEAFMEVSTRTNQFMRASRKRKRSSYKSCPAMHNAHVTYSP
jgi:hypothetical protein